MRKEKRFNWLMFLLVLILASFGSIILYIGARDRERHEAEKLKADSLQQVEQNLKTLEDSIHYFEDGM